MPFSRTEPNVPGWEEDPNSPFSFNKEVKLTCSFADSYNLVLVHYRLEKADSGTSLFDARVQGDSSSNYRQVNRDGTKVTGETEVGTVDITVDAETFSGVLAVHGRSSSVTITPLTGTSAGPFSNIRDQAQTGVLLGTGGPVSQVTLGLVTELSGTIEVFGRDV